MSRVTEPINVRLLVSWLGGDGACAGLKNSRKCTIEVLAQIATACGVEVESKPKRSELIDAIVNRGDEVFIVPEHMKAGLKQGAEDIQQGDIVSMDDFEKKYGQWLNE